MLAYAPGKKENPELTRVRPRGKMAPVAGFEPATKGLTVLCATAALHRNNVASLLFHKLNADNLSQSVWHCQPLFCFFEKKLKFVKNQTFNSLTKLLLYHLVFLQIMHKI